MINKKLYKRIVSFVIDNLEGGYYHPDMLKDGRIKDARYGNSGETMFGIDRLRGGSLNTSKAGKEFWAIIDNADARTKWKWNYKGGLLAPKLKELVAEIMYPQYDKLANRYMSAKTKEIVNKDPRLLFNFVYATWNGSGWFQRFATALSKEVEKGNNDVENLVDFVINLRKESNSSLVRQGGRKIEKIINNVPSSLKKKS